MVSDSSVMVVMDNDEIRSAMVCLLKINGYRTVEAANVKDAIVRVQHERFDVILTDLTLPLRESVTAARRIRKHALWRDVPIVVICDDDAADFRTGELAPGSNEYAVKLVDLDQLINLLSRILRRYPNAA